MADDPPLNREEFYLDVGEDDGDYELEPVDPEILASEKDRAREDMVRAQTSLDINDIYEQQNAGQELDEFIKDFKFQFQVKHMLMGTAVLAVFLSVGKLVGSNIAALLLVALAGLVVANAYFAWRDRQREARLAAKRERLVAVARAGERGELLDEEEIESQLEELDDELEEARSHAPKLRFKFSMKEVLITLTVASVMFGMLNLFGFGAVSAVLGLLAIAGLAAFAIGVEMPAILALGWWIVLLLYIAVSAVQLAMPEG